MLLLCLSLPNCDEATAAATAAAFAADSPSGGIPIVGEEEPSGAVVLPARCGDTLLSILSPCNLELVGCDTPSANNEPPVLEAALRFAEPVCELTLVGCVELGLARDARDMPDGTGEPAAFLDGGDFNAVEICKTCC